MKKRLLTLFAMAAGLFMASCSSDELEKIGPGNEAQVTFALNVENGVQTKAISDGSGAKKLVCAVYNSEGTILNQVQINNTAVDVNGQYVNSDAFKTDLTEQVSITLAKGQKYTVAFWAQNPKCTAYTTTDLKGVKVNYAGAANNDETRDAFFASHSFTVSGSASIDVTLKRPFAQINVGVTKEDWDAAVASGVEIEKSKVKIEGVANTLDLLTGMVSGNVNIEYALAAIPTETLEVDTDGDGTKETFNYLSMSYLLPNETTTGAAKTTVTNVAFEFAPKAGKNIELKEGLNTVPVQRNWRTNILGQLLTGKIEFTIKIDPIYDGEYNNDEALGVKVGDTYYKTIQEALNANATEIELAAGTYTLPTVNGKTLTITGTNKEAKIDLSETATLSGSSVTFSNLTIVKENEDYVGFHHAGDLVYNDCVFENQYWAYGTSETFNNCVFNQTSAEAYNVWTYGAKKATFNNSVFNSAGKAVLVYKENGTETYEAIFNDCTFKATSAVKGKAAIEIDSSLNPYKVTIENCSASGFSEGSKSGNSLYNLKNGDKTNCTIILQGVNTIGDGLSMTEDGKYVASTSAGIQNAIDANVKNLYLESGTYEGFFNLTNKTMTIEAMEGASVAINGMVWVDACTVTLKGLTLSNPNGTKHPNPQSSKYYATINDQNPCVGAYNNAKVTMEACTFNLVSPTVYGFYGYANNTPVFTNCTFNCNGIRPIATNGPSVTVDGCTFNDQYHYSLRIFENSENTQTVVFTNNKIQGTNTKNEFEGINISKKGTTATILGNFTIKGNTPVKYRHHNKVSMSNNCTYNTDIEGFAFEQETE